MMFTRHLFAIGVTLVSMISIGNSEEVTLRAVSAFTEGSLLSRNFERFIEKVNKDGKGIIQIKYIGGPRAIPSFEVGNAVRTKVIDIANVPGSYYTNLMPEADALKLFDKPAAEQRKNGTWAYLNELHNQKLNSQYLARQYSTVPFYLYLNKKIDKFDLAGLKIRSTPLYRDVIQSLGGVNITTAGGEIYTALERGVVDGYGWPAIGIFDFGWEKVTKFRLEPPFYSLDVNVLVNNDVWKGLTDAQRRILTDSALWLESLDAEDTTLVQNERERQTKAGIQALDFGPKASREFIKKANDLAWQSVIARSPEVGKRLRELADN